MEDRRGGEEAVSAAQGVRGVCFRDQLAARLPETPRHNLPAELTSFVGRRKELLELPGVLASSRLFAAERPDVVSCYDTAPLASRRWTRKKPYHRLVSLLDYFLPCSSV